MKILFIAMLLSVSSLSFAFQTSGVTGGEICGSDLSNNTEGTPVVITPKLPGALGGG